VSFFPKTGVVDTEGRREECIEGPSFASSRPDRSQRRGSENAGAPVSRTACGESGRPAHSRDEDPFECHKRIRIRHSKDHLVRKVQVTPRCPARVPQLTTDLDGSQGEGGISPTWSCSTGAMTGVIFRVWSRKSSVWVRGVTSSPRTSTATNWRNRRHYPTKFAKRPTGASLSRSRRCGGRIPMKLRQRSATSGVGSPSGWWSSRR
jgi:hypothetical protein